jgi:hypothetical protein
MLLFLMVAAYVGLVATAFWGAARSFARADSFWRRHRWWIWVALVAEVAYMVQAPACVYLPYVPGGAPTQRVLLGASANGTTFWLEGQSPLAFAWGPRWWWYWNPELLLPYGGLEWLPPLRYAKNGTNSDETKWEVVGSDGSRWPYLSRARFLTKSSRPILTSPDGSLLTLWDSGLHRLEIGGKEWVCVAPCDRLMRGWTEGLATFEHGVTVELYEVDRSGVQELRDRKQGIWVRQLLLRERAANGEVSRQARIDLPDHSTDSFGSPGRDSFVGATDRGPILIQTMGQPRPEGHVWRLSSDLESPTWVCRFSFDAYKSLSIAVTSDGELFTSGQAVFRITGEKVQDLDPPLKWCHWSGHTLMGVRPYPFFVAETLKRSISFRKMSAAARGTLRVARAIEGPLPQAMQAVARQRWPLGGFDEAGREDEVVEVRFP